jgi:hypothetical protein
MKLHANTLTPANVRSAARKARVDLVTFTERGSRSHSRAYDVILSGESRYRTNAGTSGGYDMPHAATWDQWGIFLAALYAVDPTVKSWAYDGTDDFHHKTADRFHTVTSISQPEYHRHHDFTYNGSGQSCACGAEKAY